jgi:protein SCO1/2
MRTLAAICLWLTTVVPAGASLTEADLAKVGIDTPENARLPANIVFVNANGQHETLGDALGGKPALFVFADYTCHTLCGPAISMAAAALTKAGLRPGADFRFVALGLDPKDPPSTAAEMKRNQIDDSALFNAATFLSGSQGAVDTITKAVGYRYTYHRENDQFAHPTAAFAVTPDGRIARVLKEVGLSPETVRLALVDASSGRIGSFGDHLRLLCYGFDPAKGIYTATIVRWLQIGSGVTLAFAAGAIALMVRRQSKGRGQSSGEAS